MAYTRRASAAVHVPSEAMAKRRKKRKFDAGVEARRAARNSGLAPAVTRVIADKRKRPAKHKKQLLEREEV